MAENGSTATFAYTADGDRAKMLLSNNDVTQLTRYYLGGQYEFDQTLGATKEKLYLGGDAYSAAAVYVKSGSGSWQVYYLGRDYQGSITHLIDNSGNLVQEISYDPWGRLRNPATQLAYAPGSEPTLFLDRGYTGHEHLAAFGLINMNARLYDPALGRFLSPDPYVQAPDFSQNFNRYSYCLNNPLRFTDPSGKWAIVDDIIVAAVGGLINLAVNIQHLHSIWQGVSYFGVGAGGAWTGLYAGPVVAGGIISAGNSVVTQGFGENGKWDSKNISFQSVLFDGIVGGATANIGNKIGGALSPYISKLTSGIGGQAVQQAIVNGVTSSASGFALGTGISLSQGETLGEALKEGGKGALQGLAIGTASGMISGMRTAYKDGENPWTGKSYINEKALAMLKKYNANKGDSNVLDCSDMASNMKQQVGSGDIYEITPKTGKWINGMEYGKTEQFEYHQIYVKNGMVYDPMYGNAPIQYNNYVKIYNDLNSGNIQIHK